KRGLFNSRLSRRTYKRGHFRSTSILCTRPFTFKEVALIGASQFRIIHPEFVAHKNWENLFRDNRKVGVRRNLFPDTEPADPQRHHLRREIQDSIGRSPWLEAARMDIRDEISIRVGMGFAGSISHVSG